MASLDSFPCRLPGGSPPSNREIGYGVLCVGREMELVRPPVLQYMLRYLAYTRCPSVALPRLVVPCT